MAAQFVLYEFISRPSLQASLHLCYSKHPAAPVFPNSSRNARTKGASSLPAGPAPSSGSAAASCLHGELKTSNRASVGKISSPEQPAAHLCSSASGIGAKQEAEHEEHSSCEPCAVFWAPSKLFQYPSLLMFQRETWS